MMTSNKTVQKNNISSKSLMKPSKNPWNGMNHMTVLQDITVDTHTSDSEEEEDISDAVLDSIFTAYKLEPGETGQSLMKAQDDLLYNFRSTTSACLICIESIKKEDAVWSCRGCFCLFHILCIQKWVKEGVNLQIYQSEDSVFSKDLRWNCPKCRFVYENNECPARYYCFCGKQVDPRFDPWLVPHSCGNKCEKLLKPDCGHLCRLLCHPGPCPPCPLMVTSTCFCQKSPPQARRCSAKLWACKNKCGKRLLCNQHTCAQVCHPGDCPPCPRTSMQSCRCGRSEMMRPCARLDWTCNEVCKKPLSCGYHNCLIICHSGECGTCPRQGLRFCPCGKTKYELLCTEEVSTCEDTCGRFLDCGRHTCGRRCHNGECGPCQELTMKLCVCGSKQKEVVCSRDYRCETRCNRLKDCRKHQCKRKCCDGTCPPCEQVCNKTLRCRNHKCSSRCHRGQCYICPVTVDIICFCGKTKVNVPCGKERSTKPPKCHQLCKIPPDCHHRTRKPHRCHFGFCPPCSFICGLALPGCGHTCPNICHSIIKAEPALKGNRKGVSHKSSQKSTEPAEPCRPCQVPVEILCYGKHEVTSMPCSSLVPYSCGQECGRRLACTNHRCSLTCHQVTNAQDGEQAGLECQECESMCTQPRPAHCNHKCLLRCHNGPCPACKQPIRMRCHCQAMVKHIPCYEWLSSGSTERVTLQSCGGPCPRGLPCGHICKVECHPGTCPRANQCKKKVTLRCPCKRQKRDVLCEQVTSGEVELLCDKFCADEKASKLQIEEKKRIMKEKHEMEKLSELNSYGRNMQSGRRRKGLKTEEAPSWWSANYVKVSVAGSIIALICAVCFIVIVY